MKKEEREAMLREHLAEMKKYENEIWARGIKYIAGVDEVGRGPLAGPVVAAAVVLPQDFSVIGVDDSKKLSAKNVRSCSDSFLKMRLQSVSECGITSV